MTLTYYTLTPQGKQVYSSTSSPNKVLKTLAELLTENDIPRTTEQIAHAGNIPVGRVQTSITSLVVQGLITTAHLPQPKEKTQTPKPRIRPIEEIVESEIRAAEARRRYNQSEKGMTAHYVYEHSEKGIIKNDKYWKEGRGRLVQRAYRIRKNIKSMQSLKIDTKDEEKRLAEIEAQLAKEDKANA